jgi:hypothetical protein
MTINKQFARVYQSVIGQSIEIYNCVVLVIDIDINNSGEFSVLYKQRAMENWKAQRAMENWKAYALNGE